MTSRQQEVVSLRHKKMLCYNRDPISQIKRAQFSFYLCAGSVQHQRAGKIQEEQ
jgi:hypothetical protein